MLRALETFYAQGRIWAAGEQVAADDPIVKGREQLFEPVDGTDVAPPKPKGRPRAKRATKPDQS